MAERKFFICKHCGNIVGMVFDAKVPMMCCGEKMTELVPNTTDAAQEKHVPVVTVDGNMVTVKVGSAAHPHDGRTSDYLDLSGNRQRRSAQSTACR